MTSRTTVKPSRALISRNATILVICRTSLRRVPSHSHVLVSICILPCPKRTARYPSLVQFLLQPCDLLQTLCFPDHLLHAFPLAGCQLYPDGLVSGCPLSRSSGNVECPRLDPLDLGGKFGRSFSGAKQLLRLFALHILHFLVIEETDCRREPDHPVTVMLAGNVLVFPVARKHWAFRIRATPTSFRVTGFSSKLKCVNLARFRNGSRSASSEMLFDVKTNVVKFGKDVASAGCM